jgi:hypothetical protein
MWNREIVSGVKDLQGTEITCGAVFHVEIRTKVGKLRQVIVTAEEGNGNEYAFGFEDDGTMLPFQVELMFMEIECLPTWFWYFTDGVWLGQFANKKNIKTEGKFSIENRPYNYWR